MRPHVMFETGISVPYPRTVFIYPDLKRMDTTYRYWRLKEKLAKRDRLLKRISKILIIPLFFILSFALLYLITPFISRFFPGFQTVFGIAYGILTFVNWLALADMIDSSRVFLLYYYKHRKFKN